MGLAQPLGSPQSRNGNRYERVILEEYAEERGVELSFPGHLVHPTFTVAACTPDAIANATRDVQAKGVGRWMERRWGDPADGAEGVPDYVVVQVQWEMLVAGVDVADVVAKHGKVDILANVAGIMDHFAPLDEVTDELWANVLAVNLNGPMRLTRAVLPGMRERGTGSVVMVASEASLRGGTAGVAYTASKHALLGLVRHVAYFYGPQGIRCNAVLPGPVATGIGASAMPVSQWAMERAVASMGVMGPIAQPEAIASVISWLGCAEAGNVNGAVVAADGGWSAA